MSVAALRAGSVIAVCLATFLGGTLLVVESQAQSPTTMRVSPEGGDHCIEVVDRRVAPDQRLQMQDCNNLPAQMFTYDTSNTRLMIGALCVDATAGQPGDIVKLSPCNGGPSQAWKIEPKGGGFDKLVGINGLCLDVRYGSTERGAFVQVWTCNDPGPNELWRFQHR
jgi:hypothetical protein